MRKKLRYAFTVNNIVIPINTIVTVLMCETGNKETVMVELMDKSMVFTIRWDALY